MSIRKASIKETGEELTQEEWARFDAAVAKVQAERPKREPDDRDKADAKPREVRAPLRGQF